MQMRTTMATSKKSKVLAPAERVDYSEYYGLLMKRREELLNFEQQDRDELKQLQKEPGESLGDQGNGSVLDTTSDYFLQLADRDRRELIEVRDALEKIHRGIYGCCEKCKLPISSERLCQIPYARLCASCQSDFEARERVHHLHSTPKL